MRDAVPAWKTRQTQQERVDIVNLHRSLAAAIARGDAEGARRNMGRLLTIQRGLAARLIWGKAAAGAFDFTMPVKAIATHNRRSGCKQPVRDASMSALEDHPVAIEHIDRHEHDHSGKNGVELPFCARHLARD